MAACQVKFRSRNPTAAGAVRPSASWSDWFFFRAGGGAEEGVRGRHVEHGAGVGGAGAGGGAARGGARRRQGRRRRRARPAQGHHGRQGTAQSPFFLSPVQIVLLWWKVRSSPWVLRESLALGLVLDFCWCALEHFGLEC
jgi:hypothetical protein